MDIVDIAALRGNIVMKQAKDTTDITVIKEVMYTAFITS